MLAGASLYDEDLDELRRNCAVSNHELLASLREDSHSAALHELTLDDARKACSGIAKRTLGVFSCVRAQGRMSKPVPVGQVDLAQVGVAGGATPPLRCVAVLCRYAWCHGSPSSRASRRMARPKCGPLTTCHGRIKVMALDRQMRLPLLWGAGCTQGASRGVRRGNARRAVSMGTTP